MTAIERIVAILINALPPLNASRFVAAASLILALYDWLLTFDDEVRLIYPGPSTIFKVLYIFIRLMTAGGLLVANYHLAGFRPPLNFSCQNLIMVSPLSQTLVIACCNFLLMRRVGPLYGNRPLIVYGLHVLFLLSYLATIGISSNSIINAIPNTKFQPLVNVCVTMKVRPTPAIFLGPLVLETVVFGLTAYKALQAAKSTPKMAPLLHVFFRDGIIHYMVMLCVRVFCIFINFALPIQFFYLGIYLLWGVVATMTTRLFINLRAVNQGDQTDFWDIDGYQTGRTGLLRNSNDKETTV
ncbi:hypothetical protein CPB86DRAFT_705994 [Serendipita vermifera]|nr:hypothetical protein CPB86DRAFT_705994 [Serendipita vermifera]